MDCEIRDAQCMHNPCTKHAHGYGECFGGVEASFRAADPGAESGRGVRRDQKAPRARTLAVVSSSRMVKTASGKETGPRGNAGLFAVRWF